MVLLCIVMLCYDDLPVDNFRGLDQLAFAFLRQFVIGDFDSMKNHFLFGVFPASRFLRHSRLQNAAVFPRLSVSA